MYTLCYCTCSAPVLEEPVVYTAGGPIANDQESSVYGVAGTPREVVHSTAVVLQRSKNKREFLMTVLLTLH